MLSAYRIGARVAWRRFAALGIDAGLEPETMYLLAESIFAYIDVLSSESAEGHAVEQFAVAGEAQLRRRRLVRMLVRETPAEPEAVEAAAADAGWPLPRTLAAVAISGRQHEVAASRLPAGTIREAIGELTCALVSDPDGPGQRAAIERAFVGVGARGGLGTTVDWTQARVSFLRAQAALELAGRREQLVSAREHAGELLLRSDPRLAADLAADRLAALRELSPGSRRRLSETLRVWLAEQGRLGQVAERLAVHPQTARYRLARLRELFGPALDDADARFWIEVALRVEPIDEEVPPRGGVRPPAAPAGGAASAPARASGPAARASPTRSRRPTRK